MSDLVTFAKSELAAAGMFDADSDYGGMLGDAVMKMIEQFAEEGHSGASASMAIGLFSRLARYEPLSPLTGDESEWTAPFDGSGTRQNRRCSHVFMRADGSAYDINGRVFREPSGCTYTSKDSHVPVTFPYTPKTEFVNVPE